MDSTLDLLTLALLPGVGPRAVRELCARGGAAAALARPAQHADLISAAAAARLRSGEAKRAAEAELERAQRLGLALIGRDEPAYPQLLRRIFDPPPVLYVRGRLEPEEGERSVALVGSRAASAQGVAWARGMARELARAGVTVVSGLARGIDSAAHQGALDGGGRTVAVLGSGLDRIYPPENAALALAIAERGGAIVSELPLGSEPRPGHFPLRNRIIAGWGVGVVIAEAHARSGALITASAALEEGREVMAVPGHPAHAGAQGTNALIRDGARLVQSAADILEELDLAPQAQETSGPADAAGAPLLEALRRDVPASLEELAERNGRPVAEILARLSELELQRQVKRLPGALFVRT